MTAIIGGAGLGLLNSSLNQQSGFAIGGTQVGQGADRAYVNVVNGNLIIQGQDEYVASKGIDLALLRTYNSQGLAAGDGDNNDLWQMSVRRWLYVTSGSLATTSGTVLRAAGDGFEQAFAPNGSAWQSMDGPNAHDQLVRNADLTWTYTPGGEGRTETYSATGQLIAERDADGNVLTYGYNATTGRLETISDASGQVTTLTYNSNTASNVGYTQLKEVKVVRLKAGAVLGTDTETVTRIRYRYDTSNRLIELAVDVDNIKDALNDQFGDLNTNTRSFYTRYTYDGTSKRVASITQFDGAGLTTATGTPAASSIFSKVDITYVAIGDSAASPGPQYRVASLTTWSTATASRTLNFTYYLGARRTDISDNGQVTSYFYDSQDRLTKVSLPQADGTRTSSSYFYDTEGNINRSFNGSGEWTKYRYSNGNLTWQWDEAGNVLRREYDANNRLIRETRYASAIDAASVDTWTPPTADPPPAGSVPAGAQVTRYVYDTEQHLRFVITAEGRVTRHVYDNNVNQTSGPGYLTATTQYLDPYGGDLSGSDATLITNLETWCGTANRASRVDYGYDLTGQLKLATRYGAMTANGGGDANAASTGTTYYIYSAAGELLQVIDGLGAAPPSGGGLATSGSAHVTTYTYDGLYRLATTADGAGRTTTSVWQPTTDAYGGAWVTSTLSGPGGTGLVVTKLYNRAGELVATLQGTATDDDKFGRTEYVYDTSGRLRMVRLPGGGRRHYFYDARGFRVGEVDPDGALTEYVYVGSGQIKQIIRYDGKITQSVLVDGSDNPTAVTLQQLRGGAAAGTADSAPTLDLDANNDHDPGATTGYSTSAMRGTATAIVDGDRAVTDSGDADSKLTGATAYIAQRFDGTAETLSVAGYSNGQTVANTAIVITVDNSRGMVTLSGLDTVANYKTVLSLLRYTNSNLTATTNGATAIRHVHIAVEDGENFSPIAIAKVTVTAAGGGSAMKGAVPVGEGAYTSGAEDPQPVPDENPVEDPVLEDDAPPELEPEDVVGGLEQTQIETGRLKGELQAWLSQNPAEFSPSERAAELKRILSEIKALVSTLGVQLAGYQAELSSDEALLFSPQDAQAILEQLTDVDGVAEVVDSSVTTTGPTLPSTAVLNTLLGRLGALYVGAGEALAVALEVARPVEAEDGQLAQAMAARPVPSPPASVPAVSANANTRISTKVYDDAGRLKYDVDEVRHVVEYLYDGRSQLIQTIAYEGKLGAQNALTLTSIRNAVATLSVNSGTRSTRYYYSADGQQVGTLVTTARNAATDTAAVLTKMFYDNAGRLVQTKAYATPITNSTAIQSGVFTSLVPSDDPQNDQSAYRFYDARNQLVGELDAMGYLTSYKYDKAGNRASQIRFDKTFQYVAGQSLQTYLDATDGTVTTHETVWTYDGLNRVSTLKDRQGSAVTDGVLGTASEVLTTYAYDPITGYLTSTTRASGTSDARTQAVHYNEIGWLETDGDGYNKNVVRAYDDGGRLKSVTDRNGKVTLYYYDDASRLRYTVQEAFKAANGRRQGEVTERRYDAFGELDTVVAYADRINMSDTAGTLTLSGGLVSTNASFKTTVDGFTANSSNRVETYEYNLEGLLAKTTDTWSNTLERFYDDFSAVATTVSTTVQTGEIRTDKLTYDQRGYLATRTEDANTATYTTGIRRKWTWTVDSFGRQGTAKDGLDNLTTTTYDRLNRIAVVTGPGTSPSISQSQFDAFGRTVRLEDAAGVVTRYTYDDALRQVTTKIGNGGASDVTFSVSTNNRHDQQVSITINGNETTSYTYDLNGRLYQVTNPDVGTTTNTYDDAGNLKNVRDARGVDTAYEYDAANRVLSRTVDPTGLALKTSYVYDAFGQTIRMTDPNGVVTETVFDQKGEVTLVVVDTAGLKLATAYDYDGTGLRVTAYEGLAATWDGTKWNVTKSAALKKTSYQYDHLNRLTSEAVDPDGLNLVTSYFYDNEGHVVRKRDANGQDWRFAFDVNGRQTFAIDPLGGVTKSLYDPAGRIIGSLRFAQALGLSGLADADTDTTYQSRTASFESNSANEVLRTIYDFKGRKIYEVDAAGAVTRCVTDDGGKVVREIAYAKTIDVSLTASKTTVESALMALYGGTNLNNANSASDTRNTQYAYDGAGRLVYSVDALGFVDKSVYDAGGNVVSRLQYAKPVSVSTSAVKADIDAALAAAYPSGADSDSTTRRSWNVVDAAGRSRFTIDAVGAVVETRYDADGQSIQTLKYATAIALPTSLPTEADVYLAIASAQSELYSNNFASNLTGLTETDTAADQVKIVSGALNLTSASGTAATPGVQGNKLWEITEEPTVFRAKVTVGATSGLYLTHGLENGGTGANYRRHGVLMDGDKLYAQYWDPSASNYVTVLLGTIPANSTWTVEVVATSSSSTVYAYRSSTGRAGGFAHRIDYSWTDARIMSRTRNALGQGAQTVKVDDFQIVTTQNADNQLTARAYDAAGRMTSVARSGGGKIANRQLDQESFAYWEDGAKKTYTNGNGDTWKYDAADSYDGARRLVRERTPNVTVTTLNGTSGLPTSVGETQSSLMTRFVYDKLGNVTQRIENAGSTANRRVTTFVYDELGRQYRSVSADAYTVAGTEYGKVGVYDVSDDVGYSSTARDTFEDKKALVTDTWYDPLGNAFAARDAAHQFSYKIYDTSGRVRFEIDATRTVTKYDYDGFGNVSVVRHFDIRIDATTGGTGSLASLEQAANTAADADNGTDPIARSAARTAALAAFNKVVALVGPNGPGNTNSRTLTTTYDTLGRKLSVVQSSVRYYIPADGVIAEATGAAAPTTEYSYDAFGGVTSRRSLRAPGVWATEYFGYDNVGHVRQELDALGYYTTSQYDSFGRVTLRTEYAKIQSAIPRDANGAPIFAGYVAQERSASSAGADSNPAEGYDRGIGYQYDYRDLRVRETQYGAQFTEIVNGAIQTHVENVVTSRSYDDVGNLVASTDAAQQRTEIVYDALGRKIAVKEPDRVQQNPGIKVGVRVASAQYAVQGDNAHLNVQYSSLAGMGTGDVRITVTYHDVALGNQTKIVELDASRADEGATVDLRPFGRWSSQVDSVQSVQVDKSVNNAYVSVYTATSTSALVGSSAPKIEITGIPAAATSVQVALGSSSAAATKITGGPWVRLLTEPGSAAGIDYSFTITANTSLVSVGGSAAGVLTGTCTVFGGTGQPSAIRIQGAGTTISALSIIGYDALGNATREVKFGEGNVALPADYSGMGMAIGNKDSIAYHRYDVLGRVTEDIDVIRDAAGTASGVSQSYSYDEFGKVRRNWALQRDYGTGTGMTSPTTLTRVEVSDYDAAGRKIRSTTPVRSEVWAESISTEDSTYNAFGEVDGKGVDGTIVEFSRFDAAGRPWLVYAQGVLKGYQYDLMGNVSRMIELPATATNLAMTAPSSLATLFDASAGPTTVFIRDAQGRVISERAPGIAAAERVTNERALIASAPQAATVNITSQAAWEDDDADGRADLISGNNTLTVAWRNLSALQLGAGTLSYSISYTYQNVNFSNQPSVRTGSLSATTNATGVTVSWPGQTQAHPLAGERLVSVQSFRVLFTPTGGDTVVIVDSQASATATQIVFDVPYRIDSTASAKIDGTAKTLTDGSQPNTKVLSTAGLSPGAHTYEVTLKGFDNSVLERYTGTFTTETLSGPPQVLGHVLGFSVGQPTSSDLTVTKTQTVDRWGNVLSITDPANASWVTNLGYDHLNHEVMRRSPSVAVQQGTSTPSQRPTTLAFYDARGLQVGARDGNGNLTQYVLDAAGQRVEEVLPNGGHVSSIYDALGRVIKTQDARGTYVQLTYDLLGRLVTRETLGYAAGQERNTSYYYDEAGNRVGEKNGAGELTRYRYDTKGRVVAELSPLTTTTITGASSYRTRYQYDSRDRKTQVIDAKGGTQSWAYVDFRLDSYTDIAGSQTTYQYDDWGRVTLQSSEQVSDPGTGTLTHGWVTSYSYFANGWLSRVTDNIGRDVRYDYDSAGRHARESFVSGTTPMQDVFIQYDGMGRISRLQDQYYHLDYGYDANSNRVHVATSYVNAAGGTLHPEELWYAYDQLNRLTVVDGAANSTSVVVGSSGTEIAYDLAGNRRYARDASASSNPFTLYQYDLDNRLTTTQRASDAAGTVGSPGTELEFAL